MIRKTRVTLLTIADGSGTVYSDAIVNGRLMQMRYTPSGGGANLATGADLTITLENSGVAVATLTDIGTSAFTKAIRQPTHGLTGTALVYASTDAVAEPVVATGERIKVVIAQGGDTKGGTLDFWVER